MMIKRSLSSSHFVLRTLAPSLQANSEPCDDSRSCHSVDNKLLLPDGGFFEELDSVVKRIIGFEYVISK